MVLLSTQNICFGCGLFVFIINYKIKTKFSEKKKCPLPSSPMITIHPKVKEIQCKQMSFAYNWALYNQDEL